MLITVTGVLAVVEEDLCKLYWEPTLIGFLCDAERCLVFIVWQCILLEDIGQNLWRVLLR